MLEILLNADPVAFSIGPLEVRWYGLAYLAGMLLGLSYAKWIVRRIFITDKTSITTQHLDEIFIWIVLGIIFGARIGYIIFYQPSLILINPLSLIAIWEGGMSFHGGAIGVILALIFFSKIKRISLLQLGDVVCSVVPIGLFFGRLANFINSELWGKTTSMPWGVIFTNAGPTPRHPSQLYEAALEGILILIILFILIKKDYLKYKGFISGSFLFLYAAFRIFIENFREPDAHIGYIYNFITMGMILSIPLLIAGLILIIYSIRVNGKN